jgi:hypothetical protein
LIFISKKYQISRRDTQIKNSNLENSNNSKNRIENSKPLNQEDQFANIALKSVFNGLVNQGNVFSIDNIRSKHYYFF